MTDVSSDNSPIADGAVFSPRRPFPDSPHTSPANLARNGEAAGDDTDAASDGVAVSVAEVAALEATLASLASTVSRVAARVERSERAAESNG